MLIPWLLILPLLMAVISSVLPRKGQFWLAWPAFVGLFWVTGLLWAAVAAGDIQHYQLGGWAAPLGIGLRIDGLAIVMLGLTAVLACLLMLYACFYLQLEQAILQAFWPLLWFLVAALNGLWMARDIFTLYVCLELVTLASIGLAALRGDAAALAACLRYLLIALLGSLFYLLGVALWYGAHGVLALDLLAQVVGSGWNDSVALVLMLGGMAIKAALFPMHGWLPPTHGGALTPVSALLSGLVVKAGFYVMVRLSFETAPNLVTPMLANTLGGLGALAVFWGGWCALRQQRLKMIVAYSTVAQLGYLFLLFPLFMVTHPEAQALAWQGASLQLIGHAFAKAGMFLAAGNLIIMMRQDDLRGLIGASRYRPVAVLIFGFAGVTLMGLPPSAGFNAKWLLMHSAWLSGQWWWTLVLALGGLMTVAYLFRVFRIASREPAHEPTFGTVPLPMTLIALALTGMGLLLGLASAHPMAVVIQGAPLGVGL